MTSLAEWPKLLTDAAKVVPRVRSYLDPTADVEPPGVIIGPPAIEFDGYSGEPTAATFPVYAFVAWDEFAVARLIDLGPRVAAAITENLDDAVVTRAEPTVFNAGGTDLPAYQITVEVSLT